MRRFGKILAVAALAMVSYSASAELAPQWTKGTMIGNAGVGVYPVGATVSVDYVLVDSWWMGHFTVGGQLDFGKHDTYYYDKDITLGFSPRVTYGLNITPEFEVHATALVGLGMRTWTFTDGSKTKDTTILWDNFIGCRYFFLENMAAFAETGFSGWFPALRAGISYKF